MKNTTTDYNGNKVNIKEMKDSLRLNFPSYAQKDISDEGEPFLSNCVIRDAACGCTIKGNGTLQFPLMVHHCAKHSQ